MPFHARTIAAAVLRTGSFAAAVGISALIYEVYFHGESLREAVRIAYNPFFAFFLSAKLFLLASLLAFTFMREGRGTVTSILWLPFSVCLGAAYYLFVAGWLDFDENELIEPVWIYYAKTAVEGTVLAVVLGSPALLYWCRYFLRLNGRR